MIAIAKRCTAKPMRCHPRSTLLSRAAHMRHAKSAQHGRARALDLVRYRIELSRADAEWRNAGVRQPDFTQRFEAFPLVAQAPAVCLAAGGGAKVLPVDARNREEIERGLAAVTRECADAVIILVDSFFIGQRRQIAELAARNRLPSMYSFREDAEAGGLMSYGQNLTDPYRQAAAYVDKILKGAKPGELPIEQAARFHLAVNRKTAKTPGLAIPQELLLRADELIE